MSAGAAKRPFNRYPLGGKKQVRLCRHPNCEKEAEFKAPKSPRNVREYYWFCLEHVREYNASWNFCEGMHQADIDDMVKADLQWGRPTWPLGHSGASNEAARDIHQRKSHRGKKDAKERHFRNFKGRIYDPFDLYDETMGASKAAGGPNNENRAGNQFEQTQLKQMEIDAYRILGFDYPADEETVKQRYKKLAKDLHPDLNKNDFRAGERLKEVNNAYSCLKKTFIS